MELKELRYNFITKEATIRVPTAVENASEIADAINKFFIEGSVDCTGYEYQPKGDITTFLFRVENSNVLNTLTSVLDKYLTRYEP